MSISKDKNEAKEKEDENEYKDIVVSDEKNLNVLPIFSTLAKRDTKFQPSKTIDLGVEKFNNGDVRKRKIKIVPTAEYGYPTVKTQEVWLALQYLLTLSEEAMKTGEVKFSIKYLLTKVLNRGYGTRQRNALIKQLSQLSTTYLEFKNVFYDKKNDITHSEIKKFHLITSESIVTRENSKEVVRDKCCITINPLLVSNIYCGHVTPVLLSNVCKIKSDIGKLLYSKLDSHFAYKNFFEMSSKRFFQENGLNAVSYNNPSVRFRAWKKGAEEIKGLLLSSGYRIKDYRFEKSADNSDWKLLVWRSEDRVNIKHKGGWNFAGGCSGRQNTSSDAPKSNADNNPTHSAEKSETVEYGPDNGRYEGVQSQVGFTEKKPAKKTKLKVTVHTPHSELVLKSAKKIRESKKC